MMIRLDTLRLDGGTQPRSAIDPAVVGDYANAMRAGDTFPRPTVFHDGAAYWLADGFHRVEAARATGAVEIDCVIMQGTRRDAILHSVGANADHGVRRTNADKRRAIETLLRDEEWVRRSDSWIGQQCKVDHKTVARARTDLGFPKSRAVEGQDGRTIDVTQIGRARMPSDFPSALAEISRVTAELRRAQHHEDCVPAINDADAMVKRASAYLACARTFREIQMLAGERIGHTKLGGAGWAYRRDEPLGGAFADLLHAREDCRSRCKESLEREAPQMEGPPGEFLRCVLGLGPEDRRKAIAMVDEVLDGGERNTRLVEGDSVD